MITTGRSTTIAQNSLWLMFEPLSYLIKDICTSLTSFWAIPQTSFIPLLLSFLLVMSRDHLLYCLLNIFFYLNHCSELTYIYLSRNFIITTTMENHYHFLQMKVTKYKCNQKRKLLHSS